MIRVLVAEDSPTARALLVRILSADPEITIVGEARNGVEAVEMTQRLRPDIVTMDVHMPLLDGLAATKAIMITAPTPIVIVTGSTRAKEVGESLETLRLGALDVLVKPIGPESPEFEGSARLLVSKVKLMSQVQVVRHWRAIATPKPVPTEPPQAVASRAPRGRIVAIATSTGGPAAVQKLLASLPDDFPAPILIVQHITPGFTAGLVGWLATTSRLRVKLAEAGEPLAPKTVFLGPDGKHLGVTQSARIELSNAPPVGGFRPSGTFLFDSVARVFGHSTLAVILTGMGDDGVAGLRAVRAAGGLVIAQNEETSVVFGMPGATVAAGLADHVLPLDAIGPRLAMFVGR